MCIVRHHSDAALGRISCCASQAGEASCNAGYGQRRSAGLRAIDRAGRGVPRVPRLARTLRGDGSARALPPGPTRTAPRTDRAPATLAGAFTHRRGLHRVAEPAAFFSSSGRRRGPPRSPAKVGARGPGFGSQRTGRSRVVGEAAPCGRSRPCGSAATSAPLPAMRRRPGAAPTTARSSPAAQATRACPRTPWKRRPAHGAPAATRTSCLPKFWPFSTRRNARGICSIPSRMSSRWRRRPDLAHWARRRRATSKRSA
jgi:hypothetical protein